MTPEHAELIYKIALCDLLDVILIRDMTPIEDKYRRYWESQVTRGIETVRHYRKLLHEATHERDDDNRRNRGKRTTGKRTGSPQRPQ